MNISFAMTALQVGIALMGKFDEAAKDGILTADEALGLIRDAIHAYEGASGKKLAIRLDSVQG